MMRDEVVSLIQTRLGFRTDKSAEIVAELKFWQTEFEHDDVLPWFLLSEVTTASTITGEERVYLPTGFLREYEEGFLWRYDAAEDDPWIELGKDDYDALKAAKTGTGPPTHYALRGSYFTLHPTPDAVYTLKLLFYKSDTVLSSNIENGWLREFPGLLLGAAGVTMASALKDREAEASFAAQLALAKERLNTFDEARNMANMSASMGDD